jgi:hypothetical protein
MNDNDLEVTFTHPRDASTFTAYLNPQCTGQQAIRGLIAGDENGPFLDPAPPGRPYELALKPLGLAITPNTTFAEAGVTNGAVVEVRQGGQGAYGN